MSRTRQFRSLSADQEPFLTARSLAASYSNGYVIEGHRHAWHQLLFACSGAMTVFGDRMSWMVPPGRAVLIPAGIQHSIRMWGEVAVRFLYFPPDFSDHALNVKECRVISVEPLLRELILRTIELSALDSRRESEVHLMSVLMDELSAASISPLSVPLPMDSRALAAAARVLKNPADNIPMPVLARESGLGPRTLERLFQEETGLSFVLWRQKVRLLESLRILAQGESVTNAALESGYSSVSAFIAAFKRTFGYTPGALETHG
jgi:AraC-like DNA-binding protein